MRFVTVVFTGWVLLCVSASAQVKSESDLIDKLSSPSLAERREAVRSFDPENIGNLDPELAIRAVVLAAQDADSLVRETALGGLGNLAAAVHPANTNPSAAAFARAMHGSRELRPLLERIVIEDQSAKVAYAASIPFMKLYGSDPAAEAILLDRVDREPDIFERLRLLSSLAIGGIDGDLTLDRLARYLDGAPLRIQTRAAHLLLSANTLPKDRFEDFLRLIETPEAFADPQLVSALSRFDVSPDKYLPRLLAMQSRLDEELQKPRDQRTLAIYNDAYWKQSLDEAIAAARKNINTKQS